MADLEQTFRKLRENDIKLNPKKCIFGVPRGMLLGFIVSERGIKANPIKILAITKMGWILNLKGVQKDTWCLAALSCFISCLDKWGVAPGFKDKTRYTLYVSPGSQISHIATNKDNIKKQRSIYNVLSIKDTTERQLRSLGEDSNP